MKKIRLTSICSPKQWRTIPTKDLLDEGYPVYGANGVIGYCKEYNHTSDTIIIGCRGSCGNVNIARGKSYINGNAMCLDDLSSDVDILYLYYFLQNYDFRSVISGTTIPQVTKQGLEKIDVVVSSKENQREIVRQLQLLDSIIEERHKELRYFDALIKSRFIEMFGTLSSNEQNFKVLTIESLCSLIKDGTHQTPTYTEDTINGFKFLSSKDVMSKKIDWSDIKYIPSDLHEKLYAVVKPIKNDILMSKNGVNYGVAAVNDTDEVFDIYVSLALLRPKTDIINPVYFRSAINSPDTKRQFDSSIKGIGVPNLHLGEIKKTKILVPPVDKQNEYVSFVEQVDKSKFEIQQSLEKLEILKKSLMQQYFG